MLMGGMMDRALKPNLAIVDLDLREGARTLLSTAAGVLQVIAITSKAKPWLASLQRHRRIGATLTKPVSPETLREAFQRVGSVVARETAAGHLVRIIWAKWLRVFSPTSH